MLFAIETLLKSSQRYIKSLVADGYCKQITIQIPKTDNYAKDRGGLIFMNHDPLQLKHLCLVRFQAHVQNLDRDVILNPIYT